MRGYLASYVNMCWGMGLFLAAGVVRASLLIESNWGEVFRRNVWENGY